MRNVRASVIICTYNRAPNLEPCLRALYRQDANPTLVWEIIIVDNNSTDSTAKVVEQLSSGTAVPVRYVFEPNQGLSSARNRGIMEANGEYLLFIDDDITVGRGWLEALADTLMTRDCDAVGGPILLDPAVRLPTWITEEMKGFLGYRYFGEQPFRMDGRNTFPFGGNMALARSAIEKVGLYDERVGRRGDGKKLSELTKGMETNYFARLAGKGGDIWYVPDAIVQHEVLPHQLRKSYFRKLHFAAGYQQAILDKTSYGRSFHGIPLFVAGQLARATGRYLWQTATQGADAAFRQQMTVGHFAGLVLGYARTRVKSVSGAQAEPRS